MRDSLPSALAGLVLGLLARHAWPELGQLLALLGWN
jgi:hypothetical protein